MPVDTIPVSLKCKVCGTTITWSDDAVDSTEISCANCGQHLGTYRDLSDAAVEAVRSKIEGAVEDIINRG